MTHHPLRLIITLAATLLLTAACSDSDTLHVRTLGTDDIFLQMPDGVDGLKIRSQDIAFLNRTTGQTVHFATTDNMAVRPGLYDITYTASVEYNTVNADGETAVAEGTLVGKEENVEITDEPRPLHIELFLQTASDDFIFEEIFFSGTLRASGSQYYGDSYIKIYNNTDHVLYADGLAFCESKFKSTLFFEYFPDIRRDTMTVWSLYVVPGSGQEHPVQPGQSMIICDTGIDHRTANPNSFDLSAADFEWYDVSTQPAHMDIDSPTVPNMDKWYCYTLSFYLLHNRGFTSFALARIPKDVTKEQYLKDYFYTYDYIQYTQVGEFPMSQSAYKIPNAWIVDGVNCSVEAERLWNLLPPSVDAGWTHCGTIDHDKTRYFKSVRRKLDYLNADGTMHLKDTNNSTDDFNTECVPSIIEQQGTAIDAQGTPATQRTYDGVRKYEY